MSTPEEDTFVDHLIKYCESAAVIAQQLSVETRDASFYVKAQLEPSLNEVTQALYGILILLPKIVKGEKRAEAKAALLQAAFTNSYLHAALIEAAEKL